MRVAIFFDGKNFYRALEEYDRGLEIDYDRFARWVTETVAGPTGVFVGAYYYTGHVLLPGAGARNDFTRFLLGLEMRYGYYVIREPRVSRTARCGRCGQRYSYKTEKRVDTRLAVDMVHFAAVDGYDFAVLASGDQDFVPAVEAVNKHGKRVLVGVWPRHGLSRDLRVRCFGEINFELGASSFRTARTRPRAVAAALPAPPGAVTATATVVEARVEVPVESVAAESVIAAAGAVASVAEAVLSSAAGTSRVQDADVVMKEIMYAERHLPYVSRWYLENKWRSSVLPTAPEARSVLIDRAIASGQVEAFQVLDGKGRPTVALRKRA